jgi:predicted O-methyltransferase YrrM
VPEEKVVRTFADIPGWFTWTDQQLFRHFLGSATPERPGVLVELGVYMGKSAALIGEYLRPGERFVVCDLFNEGSDPENDNENRRSYPHLTRQRFEDNYRAVHGVLPEIVQGLSSTITEHVEPGTARFVHVDASHLYEHVVADIESAATMLGPGGIVVFDDYRSPHTPGVAAAVWAAVATGTIQPVCVTPSKLYATVSDVHTARQGVQDWLLRFGRLMCESQQVAGVELLRIWPPPAATPAPAAAPAPAPARQPDPEVQELLRRANRKLTRLEKEVARVNQQLEQRFGTRVQRSLVRRVKSLRDRPPADPAG